MTPKSAHATASDRSAEAPTSPANLVTETGMPARRRNPRVEMKAKVDLHSDSNFYNGFSANVSDGGVFVAAVDHPPLGAEVALTFSLPTGESITAHGRVKWIREVNDRIHDQHPGVGIAFEGLKPEDEGAIKRFVASRDPLFFPD